MGFIYNGKLICYASSSFRQLWEDFFQTIRSKFLSALQVDDAAS
jgi:hypothetical protein